jgi:hypothetical protein
LNPIGDLLLRCDPLLAAASLVAWLGVIALAVQKLPERLAFLMAFACAFGHACGAASWLVDLGAVGWALAVLLLITAERLVVLSWRRSRIGVPVAPRPQNGTLSPEPISSVPQ